MRHCSTSREPESAATAQLRVFGSVRWAETRRPPERPGGPETSRRSSPAACRVHTSASMPRACRGNFNKGSKKPSEGSLANCRQRKILTKVLMPDYGYSVRWFAAGAHTLQQDVGQNQVSQEQGNEGHAGGQHPGVRDERVVLPGFG